LLERRPTFSTTRSIHWSSWFGAVPLEAGFGRALDEAAVAAVLVEAVAHEPGAHGRAHAVPEQGVEEARHTADLELRDLQHPGGARGHAGHEEVEVAVGVVVAPVGAHARVRQVHAGGVRDLGEAAAVVAEQGVEPEVVAHEDVQVAVGVEVGCARRQRPARVVDAGLARDVSEAEAALVPEQLVGAGVPCVREVRRLVEHVLVVGEVEVEAAVAVEVEDGSRHRALLGRDAALRNPLEACAGVPEQERRRVLGADEEIAPAVPVEVRRQEHRVDAGLGGGQRLAEAPGLRGAREEAALVQEELDAVAAREQHVVEAVAVEVAGRNAGGEDVAPRLAVGPGRRAAPLLEPEPAEARLLDEGDGRPGRLPGRVGPVRRDAEAALVPRDPDGPALDHGAEAPIGRHAVEPQHHAAGERLEVHPLEVAVGVRDLGEARAERPARCRRLGGGEERRERLRVVPEDRGPLVVEQLVDRVDERLARHAPGRAARRDAEAQRHERRRHHEPNASVPHGARR
jgi:hypothetical protein